MKTTQTVSFITNYGSGSAEHAELPVGTTINGFFAEKMPGENIKNYTLRVNRQAAASDQMLLDGDQLTIAPRQIRCASIELVYPGGSTLEYERDRIYSACEGLPLLMLKKAHSLLQNPANNHNKREAASLVKIFLDPEWYRKKRNKMSPIHELTVNGDTELVRQAVAWGADLTAQNRLGDTPLHCAAWKGHYDIVRVLVEGGADVNAASSNGETPLFAALNRVDIAEFLLNNGADPSASRSAEDYNTVLHSAACQKNGIVTKLIISTGVDINPTNAKGETPLHLSARWDALSCAEILLKNGADADRKDFNGETPLLRSRSSGMVKLLVSNGADPHIRFSSGETPLLRAAQRYDIESADFLLKNGADPNIKTSRPNMTAYAGKSRIMPIDNIRTHSGNSPLHLAVHEAADYLRFRYSKTDPQVAVPRLLELLIGAGADVNAVNDEGISPIQIAVQQDNKKIIKILYKHGAVYRPELDYPLLFAVVIEHNCKKVKSLLNKGGNVNARDPIHHWTLLHWAAACGDLEMIQVLASHGAVLNARNVRGETPLHLAIGVKVFADMVGHLVVDKLIKYGATLQANNFKEKAPLDYLSTTHATCGKIISIAKKNHLYEESDFSGPPDELRFMVCETVCYLLLCNREKKEITIGDQKFTINKTPWTAEQKKTVDKYIWQAHAGSIQPFAYLMDKMPELKEIIGSGVWEQTRSILHAESMRRFKTIKGRGFN